MWETCPGARIRWTARRCEGAGRIENAVEGAERCRGWGRDGGGRHRRSCAARAAHLAGCSAMGRRAPEVAGRPIAATAPDDRGRCSSADGGQGGRRDGGGGRHRAAQCVHCALAGLSARGGGRDGGGRRARAAQCEHCALDGCSARGDGRDGSRAAARAAAAWKNQRRHSGAGGDPVGRRAGGGRRAQAAQCAHCALAG